MTGSEKTHVQLATGTSQLMSPAQPCVSAFPCLWLTLPLLLGQLSPGSSTPAHWPCSSPHSFLPSSLSVAAARAQAQHLYAVILWSSIITTLHFSYVVKSPQSQHAPDEVEFPPPHPGVVTSSHLSGGQLLISPLQHAYHPCFTRNM